VGKSRPTHFLTCSSSASCLPPVAGIAAKIWWYDSSCSADAVGDAPDVGRERCCTSRKICRLLLPLLLLPSLLLLLLLLPTPALLLRLALLLLLPRVLPLLPAPLPLAAPLTGAGGYDIDV
jgi:hypothetical protein